MRKNQRGSEFDNLRWNEDRFRTLGIQCQRSLNANSSLKFKVFPLYTSWIVIKTKVNVSVKYWDQGSGFRSRYKLWLILLETEATKRI